MQVFEYLNIIIQNSQVSLLIFLFVISRNEFILANVTHEPHYFFCELELKHL